MLVPVFTGLNLAVLIGRLSACFYLKIDKKSSQRQFDRCRQALIQPRTQLEGNMAQPLVGLILIRVLVPIKVEFSRGRFDG